MKLKLQQVSPHTRGIYTVKGKGPDSMPDRMLRLHPDAAVSFAAMEAKTPLVYSDVWRSAEESLRACQEKRGVQPPAFSAHNYGLAVDVAVDATLARTGWTYQNLLDFMAKFDWHCYRRDGKLGSESWHFNYLGSESTAALVKAGTGNAWSMAAEHMIQFYYGAQLALTPLEVQQALKELRIYNGPLDGDIGPRSKTAIQAFERAWVLAEQGVYANPRMQRTLAFVTADLDLAQAVV